MFWVMEQLPGFVVSADQTAALRTNGYWGSYNIPFYKKVYEISGFEQMWVQPLRAAHVHCPCGRRGGGGYALGAPRRRHLTVVAWRS